MSAPGDIKRIRIAVISGRYLIFDPAAVAVLRRREYTNGTLVGTAPQQPMQNIFLGLPIELRPEEAYTLVRQHVAYIVDEVDAYKSGCGFPVHQAKSLYLESLRKQKQVAQRVLNEISAMKASRTAVPVARTSCSMTRTESILPSVTHHLPNNIDAVSGDQLNLLSITPTFSDYSGAPGQSNTQAVDATHDISLTLHFYMAGYYMTPGLRFGSRYSVYPGDPLRFHAHFMANRYDWNEEIPVLDLVVGGRLATAVKKAFLIGGPQKSVTDTTEPVARTFSMEWAGM